MKKELEKAKEIKEEVISATNDPSVVADLDAQIAKLEDDLTALDDKVKARKTKLEGVISQGDAFENDFDDFLRWMTKAERNQTQMRPVSADADTAKHQKDEYQVKMLYLLLDTACCCCFVCSCV
jgi:predicted  nucleic acid-binding Zn-ribbon protein